MWWRQKVEQTWQNDPQKTHALLVDQGSEAPFLLFTYLFPLSPLLLLFWTNPSIKMEDLCMLESQAFYLLTPLLLLCSAGCGPLKKYPLLWIITDSTLFLLSIDLHKTASHSSLITTRTATPVHDRKADTTPKMNLFYQHNNMTKYSCKEPV